MIRRDKFGFVVDTPNGDGGDSANRAGLLALTYSGAEWLAPYENNGLCLRHPTQAPWNNPRNFSRDQLIPYMAGLWRRGYTASSRRVFLRHAKRLFFCQNFERDYPGTTKYPWPHSYEEDSIGPFFSLNIKDAEQKTTVFKWFDFADPLMPNDIAHLIKCARLYPLYWFLPIGWLFLVITVLAHRYDKSDDEGQIISECVVAGKWAVALYRLACPDFASRLNRYWGEWRNASEMATRLIDLVNEK